MQKRHSVGLFTGAYGLARSANLLQTHFAKRTFASLYFLYKRFWEDPFWNLVQQRPELFAGGNILDIGANIGYTSCLFAGALGERFKVYSFEPDQESFRMLEETIARKKLAEKIVAIHAAMGNAEGTVEFWHNEEHAGDHRVVTGYFRSACDAKRISQVPLTSVDAFVAARELDAVSLIKIDVQGYELPVCAGMERTLQKFPELCVCCEYSPQGLSELGYDPAEVLKFFRNSGRHIHVLTRSAIALAEDDAAIERATGDAGYVDLLCSPRALG